MARVPPDGDAAARLARLGAACAACFGRGGAADQERVAAVAAALGACARCTAWPACVASRAPRADCVTAADVGLAAEAAAQPAAAAQGSALTRAAARLAAFAGLRTAAAPASSSGLRYLALHDGADFTVGVFCLDAGASLPLHDHPGMTVLSRLLYGQLTVRSFDWEEGGGGAGGGGAARLVDEALLRGPAPTRVLRPRQGNLHTLHAKTAAAVLDVLGPPYEPRAGRPCSYFREAPPLAQAPGDAARLERVPPSADFLVGRSDYNGAPMRVPLL